MEQPNNVSISLRQEDDLELFNSKEPEALALAHKIDKTPRYYQINGIRKLNHYLADGFKRILFIMPTGTGKTLMSKLSVLSSDVRKTLKLDGKKKIRVMFIAHKNRLLRQAAQEFANCGDIELITQSAFKHVPQHVVDEGWDVTFIDEAHHEAMMSVQKLLDELGTIPIIGFTANPDRGDNLLVKFEKFIMPISKADAIEDGFISQPGVNTVVDTGGSDKTELVINLVKEYNKHMGNTIVFFKTNKECEQFYDWCCENGLHSTWLNTNSTEQMLDEALDMLSRGDIQFLINCKKVDEGIDVLNCTDVILARQFGTKSEKEQLIGRAIRPDTPCTVWELQNPYSDSVEAIQVIGSYRFRRLIYIQNNQWHDSLFEGIDEEWGLASELRFEHIKRNLGFDPRVETEEEALERKKQEGQEDIKEEEAPSGGFLVSHHKELNEDSLVHHDAPTCNPVDASVTHRTPPLKKVVEPIPNKSTKKVTRRVIWEAVEDNLKPFIKNMPKEDLIKLAKRLKKEGKI